MQNAVALTFIKMNDKKPPGGGWSPGLVMQGKVYHRIGGLAAEEGETPHFNQMYVLDPTEDQPSIADIRLGFMNLRNISDHKLGVLKRLLEYIHDKLMVCNRYVRDFKTVHETALQMEAAGQEVQHGHFRVNADGVQARPTGEHERRYNLAEGCKEIQVLMPDHGGPPPNRDVLIRPRGGNHLHDISETHRSYDPLHYTLLYPSGHEDSWNLNMKLQDPPNPAVDVEEEEEEEEEGDDAAITSQRYRAFYRECDTRGRKQLSCRDYYAHYLHEREPSTGHRDTLLRGCRAFQEYCCMAYAKIESQRLRYIDTHQTDLRAEQYDQLLQWVPEHDQETGNVGRRVILPASFVGSPRDMNARFQNAMAIVRYYGKPDYFITMTTNPNWKVRTSSSFHTT